ncbi:patatin-like phospholipase family protein [Alkalicella caledoniensis]|uniref:Patatin-like phospholipase family protein n=1 Tax=Alkalicella caledoniensis TaxID=2731377 RepID=A0A7G9W876_ALKCA|nr:patatin-like phospholipase family protein [Alkalicella caledoniensis]QNO14888.1 patatin-like phospholipase family protein [Alkalicella caledoniensis]
MLGLSFSGGGQSGIAHIGVIKGIQLDGIYIGAVSGSSVGAIMAAAVALDMPYEALEKIALNLSKSDLLDIRPNLWNFIKLKVRVILGKFSFQDTAHWSLLEGERITKILRKIYGDIKISELIKPIAITAVDVNCGLDVIFTNKPELFKEFKGLVIDDIPLYLAVRSSIAIPLIYKGVNYKKCYFVDGGLTNNLPVNLASKLGAKKVISVEVASRPPFDNKVKDILDLGSRLITIAVDNSKYYTNPFIALEPELPDVSLGDFNETSRLIDGGYKSYLEKREKILKNY